MARATQSSATCSSYDLGGNVWERCEDWYDDAHKIRTLRGTSWRTGERDRLLSSRRLDGPPEARGAYAGFRIVLAAAMSARTVAKELADMAVRAPVRSPVLGARP